jgi:HK97 family phage portal protein
MESSAVAAVVLWFARNFPEAPPALWAVDPGNGEEEQSHAHGLLRLLQRPNQHYTGPILWWATTIDWMVNGEAYWIVVPNRGGTPVELWWTPSWQMKPRGSETDPGTFIDHYEYSVDGAPYRLDPKYVVHFRYGLDPENPRRGRSPLSSVLREVFTDNEAADFTASLLRNMGIPGLLVSPHQAVELSDEEAEATKVALMDKFAGEKRGEPLVMTKATEVKQFGFSPEQLLLRELRRIPEERVSAVTGIPAVVAGLGAGLERSTFTNMAEAREAAYENGLIPSQKILGEDVRFQLLPLFGENPYVWRFGFDLSKVRVLQEDLYRLAQRHAMGVRDGIEMVAEARRALGLEVEEDRDNVFLRQASQVQVPADGSTPLPLASAGLDLFGETNGNGHVSARDLADEVIRAIERRELTGG